MVVQLGEGEKVIAYIFVKASRVGVDHREWIRSSGKFIILVRIVEMQLFYYRDINSILLSMQLKNARSRIFYR